MGAIDGPRISKSLFLRNKSYIKYILSLTFVLSEARHTNLDNLEKGG